MPPTDRHNAEERRARIASLLKELRARATPRHKSDAVQTRVSKTFRPAKAQIASASLPRAGKKR
jgi:hypothetical protein